MIAIDTNVLLRYLLADDERQYTKAKTLVTSERPVLVTDVVLAETVWTLTGKRYRLNKAAICSVVHALIRDSAFIFEDSQVVWSALRDFEDAKPIRGKELDFADALIAHKSHHVAAKSGTLLSAFYSFDGAVAQLPGAKTP